MHCPVDVSVVVFIEVLFCFDNLPRLLRCGGVVKVNEGISVDFTFQDGEVFADSVRFQ